VTDPNGAGADQAPAEPEQPSQPGQPSQPSQPSLGERLHEGRRTFQPGLWLRLTVITAGLVYLILFVVLNTKTVRVRFVFESTRVSLIWVIVLSVLIGVVLGVLLSQLHRFRSRRGARR
jgi:uncharacterized integral membrane protein